MKFQIYGKEFKLLVDRISGIVPKKALFNALESVKISAHGNSIEFSASDMTDFATITAYGNVYEDGIAWVNFDDLKKVLSIENDIIITAADGKFDIRGEKKSYEIPYYNYEEFWPETPVVNTDMVLSTQDEKELLKHLSFLNSFRSVENPNEMLSAFYLDLPNSKLVSLDGQRIGVAKLKGSVSPDARGISVDGSIYSALKSVIGKSKNSNDVKIYANDKYTVLCGEDYTLTVRNIDGKYFDYSKMMNCNNDNDFAYKFDVKEMSDISKEYSKVIGKNNAPMIFYNNNETVATGIKCGSYRTADTIENLTSEFGMDNEWYFGVNPRFIVDACNALEDEATMSGYYSTKKPVFIADDTYEFLLLPININDSDIEFTKKQIA